MRSLTPQVSIGHTEAGIDLGQQALNMGAGMVFWYNNIVYIMYFVCQERGGG